ncbi:MAG TPA: hypothetical protein ENG51_17280 [Deltaproteobacteria bacterium]|nr:hypothetical protein [Deltaproteobacteria bacterium]
MRDEISSIKDLPDNVSGFEMRRRFYFLGRWLKHGGYYGWVLRLLRRGRSRFVFSARAGEYAVIRGEKRKLNSDLLHVDQRSFTHWIQNQNRDSTKIALSLFEAGGRIRMPDLDSNEVQEGRFRAIANKIQMALPLGVGLLLRFLYFYLVRGGLLDGWQGFAYCFLHEFWFPLLIELKMREFPNNAYALEEAKRLTWR